MSEFVMVRRELLERWVKNTDFFEDLKGVSMHDINEATKEDEKITEELRAVLAQEAGHVEAAKSDRPSGSGCCCPPKGYRGIWAAAMCPVHHGLRAMVDRNKVSPPAPVSVVLPEREMYCQYLRGVIPDNRLEVEAYKDGWNACLDKVKEVNQ